MKPIIFILSLILCILSFLCATANAATYYVSPSGADGAAGDIDHPWRTITYGLSHTFAGDTLYIRAGIYGPSQNPPETGVNHNGIGGGWTLSNSYTPTDGSCGDNNGNWKIISAYPLNGAGPGYESVDIQDFGIGTTPVDVNNVWHEDGCPYVKIIGLRIHGYAGPGYGTPSIGISGHHNQLIDITNDGYLCHYFGQVMIGGHDNLVQNVTINEDPSCSFGGNNHGIYISQNGVSDPTKTDTYNITITGCDISGITGWPIHIHHDNGYTYGDVRNIIIEKNIFHDSLRSGIVFSMAASGPVHDVVVRNNLFYNLQWGGVSFGTSGGDVYNIDVYNNIFYNTNQAASGTSQEDKGAVLFAGLSTAPSGNIHDINVKNNILWRTPITGSYGIDNQNSYPSARIYNVNLSNNLNWPDNINNLNGMTMQNSITGNPQFSDVSSHNFSIQSNSAAKDAGTAISSVTDDFIGTSRPQGPAYDIGAYEYISGSQVCGDTVCNGTESCYSCPQDCGQCCGNSQCEASYGETCSSCSADCITSSGQMCCSGVIYTGNCCSSSNCISPQVCTSHACSLPDTQPPTTPTNLQATPISSIQINLAWTAATDNVGVTGYRIYRNESQAGTSAANYYSDTGLSPSTTYAYTVSAYDATGNEGSQSLQTSATTQTSNTNPGLVGYWKFDEGTGTITSDSSGNGNDAMLINGPNWVAGKYGNALSFDGVDDYVQKTSPSSLDWTGGFTISSWIFPHMWDSTYRAFFSNLDAGSPWNGIMMGIVFDAGYRRLWVFSHDYFLFPNQNIGNVNEWTHVAITYDSSAAQLKYYVNGVLMGTVNSMRQPNDTSQPIKIGAYYNNGAFFDGFIDEVRVYNKTLSSQEISDIYMNARCAHESDTDCNGCVDMGELTAYIDRWKVNNQDVTIRELIEAIGAWKRAGC
jgi:hypothetical protein